MAWPFSRTQPDANGTAHITAVNKGLERVNSAVGELTTRLISYTIRLRQQLRSIAGPPSYFNLPAALAAANANDDYVTSPSLAALPTTDLLYNAGFAGSSAGVDSLGVGLGPGSVESRTAALPVRTLERAADQGWVRVGLAGRASSLSGSGGSGDLLGPPFSLASFGSSPTPFGTPDSQVSPDLSALTQKHFDYAAFFATEVARHIRHVARDILVRRGSLASHLFVVNDAEA